MVGASLIVVACGVIVDVCRSGHHRHRHFSLFGQIQTSWAISFWVVLAGLVGWIMLAVKVRTFLVAAGLVSRSRD
jgi:hypothetical protein